MQQTQPRVYEQQGIRLPENRNCAAGRESQRAAVRESRHPADRNRRSRRPPVAGDASAGAADAAGAGAQPATGAAAGAEVQSVAQAAAGCSAASAEASAPASRAGSGAAEEGDIDADSFLASVIGSHAMRSRTTKPVEATPGDEQLSRRTFCWGSAFAADASSKDGHRAK